MSWAADGQDGNGLHLEKMRLIFLSLSLYIGKLAKTLITVYFLFEIHLISSFKCSISISCMTKVLRSNLSQV